MDEPTKPLFINNPAFARFFDLEYARTRIKESPLHIHSKEQFDKQALEVDKLGDTCAFIEA